MIAVRKKTTTKAKFGNGKGLVAEKSVLDDDDDANAANDDEDYERAGNELKKRKNQARMKLDAKRKLNMEPRDVIGEIFNEVLAQADLSKNEKQHIFVEWFFDNFCEAWFLDPHEKDYEALEKKREEEERERAKSGYFANVFG